MAGAIWRAQKGHDVPIKLRGGGDEKLVLDKLTDKTNTVQDVIETKVESTGTAAANLGAGYLVKIENASGTVAERGRLDHVLTTATAGAEDSEWQAKVSSAGTVTKIATINKNGMTLNSGTLNPGTISGTTAFTGRVTTTDGVASGTAKVVGGLAYSNTAASTAHSNTTTEALLDKSYTIPADTLKAGTVVEIEYWGKATTTNSTDTLTIKLYVGGLSGTALLTSAATDVADGDIFSGKATMLVRTAGASGTFVAKGTNVKTLAASNTAVEDIVNYTGSTVINTTTTQVIGVGADWSAASASDSVILDALVVKIF